jgi:hypothetical protein
LFFPFISLLLLAAFEAGDTIMLFQNGCLTEVSIVLMPDINKFSSMHAHVCMQQLDLSI